LADICKQFLSGVPKGRSPEASGSAISQAMIQGHHVLTEPEILLQLQLHFDADGHPPPLGKLGKDIR
jgi:hypothetical protein